MICAFCSGNFATAQICRDRSGVTVGRVAVPSATTGLDPHRLAGGQDDAGSLGGERLLGVRAGVTYQARGATRLAAGQARRAEYMAIWADREHDAVTHRPDLPRDAQAPAAMAGAA